MELRVRRATAEMEDGTLIDDDPKSEAGKRPISLPNGLRADVEHHLAHYAESPGWPAVRHPQGGVPRRRNFNRVWHRAITTAGIPAELGLHLHDLRHTGSTWSPQSGATPRELMARIGHSSTRAAMIYQHATRDRDRDRDRPRRADHGSARGGVNLAQIWHTANARQPGQGASADQRVDRMWQNPNRIRSSGPVVTISPVRTRMV
jgi:integrase